MISLAATHVPPGRQVMRKMMAEHRAGSEAAFAARLRKGVEDGDLPPDADVDAMAAYYYAVALGLAVPARDGAPRERLAEIGRIAMRAWPTTSRKNATKCRGE
ncbi:MAG TPA: hypothetical protein VIF02_02890 [Methylocella sp.]|jgi:hypothetical protein